MDVYQIVRQLLKESGKKMSDISRALDVRLSSLNRSLHKGISLEKFSKVLDECGYVLMIGKKEDNRAVNIRAFHQIEREWKNK